MFPSYPATTVRCPLLSVLTVGAVTLKDISGASCRVLKSYIKAQLVEVPTIRLEAMYSLEYRDTDELRTRSPQV